MKFICSPFSLDKSNGYVLTTLRSDIADNIINGIKNPKAETNEQKHLRLSTLSILSKNTNYPPIWPGKAGHDGYIRDCSCRKTAIKKSKRDPYSKEEIGKLIPLEEDSKTEVPILFTKSELYYMSIRHHLSNESKMEIRQRNRRSGLLHTKDVEPKTYDDMSERCVDVIKSRETEIHAQEYFLRNTISTRTTDSPNQCVKDVEREELGPAFWVVLGWAIIATLIILAIMLICIIKAFFYDVRKKLQDKFDDYTLVERNIGGGYPRRRKRHKKKGKKKHSN